MAWGYKVTDVLGKGWDRGLVWVGRVWVTHVLGTGWGGGPGMGMMPCYLSNFEDVEKCLIHCSATFDPYFFIPPLASRA